jgi:hypothetical protein
MVTKKAPAKKIREPLTRPNRTPFTRSQKSTGNNYFAHSFTVFTTILFMVSLEAFFGYPSKWFQIDTPMPKDEPIYEEILLE